MFLGTAEAGREVLETGYMKTAAPVARRLDELAFPQHLHPGDHERLVGAAVLAIGR